MVAPGLLAAAPVLVALVQVLARDFNRGLDRIAAGQEPELVRDCSQGLDRASGPVQVRGLEVDPQPSRAAAPGLALVRGLGPAKELAQVPPWPDAPQRVPSVPAELGLPSCPDWEGKGPRVRELVFRIAPRIAHNRFRIVRPA